jgi:HAD superfamily hydrolase (TIGR01456 family)
MIRGSIKRLLTSSAPLYTHKHLHTRPIGVVFDIDGVILRGSKPLPQAVDSLNRLHDHKIPFILLTNGGGEMEYKKADFLSNVLGIEISPDQVILSHTPLKPIIKQYGEEKKQILILGCKDVMTVSKEYGSFISHDIPSLAEHEPTRYPFIKFKSKQISNLDHIAAIFILHDPNNWGVELQITLDMLVHDNWDKNSTPLYPNSPQKIPIYSSNNDLLFAGQFRHSRLAAGAFVTTLKHLFHSIHKTDLVVEHYGKPFRKSFEFAEKQLMTWATRIDSMPSNSRFSKIIMVGDNPKSDIRGANNFGAPFESCLVRTGVFKGGVKDVEDPAAHVVDGIKDAVDIAVKYSSTLL